MDTGHTAHTAEAAHGVERFLLRFRSLFDEGRGLAFPCDGLGHVDMDALSDRALTNYLYARTVIGREYFTPAVEMLAA